MYHLRRASTRRHPSRLLARLAMLFFAALLAAGCGTTVPTQEPVRLTLAASSSALPLAKTIARAYHAAYAHITVDVLPRANDAAAAQSVLAGQADLALVTGAAPTAGRLSATHVATDALAVVVHPDRALDNLTGQQVQEILRGLLRTWDELPAGAGDIQVLAREQDAGPRQALTGAFLGVRPLTPTAQILPDDQQVLARVAADPQAIAALPAAWLDDSVRAVSIDGRGPDWVMRQWPGYPAELPIYLLAPQAPSPDAAALRAYLLSDRGQRLLSRSYAPAQP
jgi:phosphate transport system substrate-binding protein